MPANNIYIQVDFNSQNAQQNVNALNQSIAATGPTAEKSSKQATTGLQSIGISIQQVNREFSQLTAAMAGLGLSRALAGMVQMSAELSRSQLAMQSFTGSVEEANKVFEEVRAIAATSPFRFKDLEETAQRLLGFGMAAKNVPDTLKVITDQVARMGGSIEGVNTIVNVFGRILEKNFVGAMDLMRALPAQGVPALKAIGAEMQKQLGHPVDVDEVREALKKGLLDPLQTIRVLLDAMRQKSDASKFSDDAARAFKNLADAADNALGKLFGPQGFGPALKNLGTEIGNLLAPLGGLIDHLMKLPEPDKELIVNWAAAAAAIAAFGTALSIVTSLASPLLGLAVSIGKFTLSLATMNPQLAVAVLLLGGLAVAAYKLVPQFKGLVDTLVGGIGDKIKKSLTGLAEEGKKFFADLFKGGIPIEAADITKTDELFKKLKEEEQKHANEAQRTLLEALASPVEAVRLKYATLFAELEEKIKDLHEDQKTALRDILGGAEAAETAGAQFKENKKQLDEYTRYQVERAKGAADAQVAYIEAQDAQDLRNKVRAIDRVTQIRVEAANQIGEIEKTNLEQQFNTFVEMANQYRAEFAKAGVDVDLMIEQHRRELVRQQGMIDQKQFDESQKYRLEGWKKANDAIIEDQKRVYDAFKSQFDELFDVFTNKTKTLGQALGDFFKKLALGEARELFSSQMAGLATEAAGYGRPEETITRGGRGILGILLRRGMPPRPPLPPPEVQQIPAAVSGFNPLASSANRFEISTDAYAEATSRFAQAVEDFAGAAEYREELAHPGTVGKSRELWRYIRQPDVMPPPPSVQTMINQATAKYGLPQNLLQAVAQVESGFRPGAVSPAGAMGMLQLMPGTAAELGVTDPFSSQQSIEAGAKYLSQLLQRYGGNIPKALAAYNAGMGRVPLRGGNVPSYTLPYVAQVQALMAKMGTPPAPSVPPVSLEQLAALPLRREWQQLILPPMPTGLPAAPEAVTAAAGPMTAQTQAQASWLSRLWKTIPFGAGGTAGGAAAGPQGIQASLTNLARTFGIGGPGGTSLASVLGSQGAGGLYSLGGMMLASQGLQRRAPGLTVGGGALAGLGAAIMNPALFGAAEFGPFALAGGVALGAGAGLGAAGLQRGGLGGLAMTTAGGALAGAAIGTVIFPGLGTLAGALIGAGVGAIAGTIRLFVHTEQERIRQQIKQVYGIDISNRQILTQIQQIVDQKYGGSVTIGIRSQDVQDIVRLYALSTGQAARLPRPMYAATIAQSQAGGLAMQPVYQGGVLVQNPYTGPTTYQYQTAVTAAQGLMAGTSQGVPGASGQVGNIFMQLNPQQANDLFTGRVVQAVQQNPAAVASANASATRAGDSRVSQASNMLEPLTSLT